MSNWTAADGSVLHFEETGGGNGRPPLLLLPGLLGTVADQWQRFMPQLATDFHIIALDLRGHGPSGNNAPALFPETMVDDIAGLLDSLGRRRIHVAGYSLGGYLGLMLALRQPERVSTLLMHATKFYWSEEAVATLRRQLDPDAMAEKVPGYANQLADAHGVRGWRNLVRQAADLVAHLARAGVTEGMLAQATLPVTVCVGDRDELVPLAEAHRLSRRLQNGALLTLPRTRHPFPSVKAAPLLPYMRQFHSLPG